jgi:PTS system galactitol-specific IIA component
MDVVFVSKLYSKDWRDALTKLCVYAIRQGYAKSTLLDAIIDRERTCPTGFPVNDSRGVALPHEDIVHTKRPLVMIARPVSPLLFGRMGDARQNVAALLIIMVLSDDVERYPKTFEKLTSLLRDIGFVEKLREMRIPELRQVMLSSLGDEITGFVSVELG